MITTQWISDQIRTALPDAHVMVDDTTGTGDHFEARVVSAAFVGKSLVQQHQAVYAPLQSKLSTGELHALALKTFTPEQWAKTQG
jgi:acid stress-induced BolA-like protein IbaG/YrbA